MSGLLAERIRLIDVPSCCADCIVPLGGSDGLMFGPRPFGRYGFPPIVDPVVLRDIAGAVLRFGSSPWGRVCEGGVYLLKPAKADCELDRVEPDCGGVVSFSMGEKYELPIRSLGDSVISLPSCVLSGGNDPSSGIGNRGGGLPIDASVVLDPILPPVADRDRRLVLDAFRLIVNSE